MTDIKNMGKESNSEHDRIVGIVVEWYNHKKKKFPEYKIESKKRIGQLHYPPIGFIDVFIDFANETCCVIEVKTSIRSVGELLRQFKTYEAFLSINSSQYPRYKKIMKCLVASKDAYNIALINKKLLQNEGVIISLADEWEEDVKKNNSLENFLEKKENVIL